MRRVLRILLNAAAVVSLVLCVAAVVVWIRSHGNQPTLAEKVAHLLKQRVAPGSGSLRYAAPAHVHQEIDVAGGKLCLTVYGSDALNGLVTRPAVAWGRPARFFDD